MSKFTVKTPPGEIWSFSLKSVVFPFESIIYSFHAQILCCFPSKPALSLLPPLCSPPVQKCLSALRYTVACTHVLCFSLTVSPLTQQHRLLLWAHETSAHKYLPSLSDCCEMTLSKFSNKYCSRIICKCVWRVCVTVSQSVHV